MDAQFALLQQFIMALKADSKLIHHPKLGFFREYVESLGATIPAKPAEPEPTSAPQPEPTKAAEPEPEPMEEEEPEIPMPEIDNSDVIEPDAASELPMGDENKETTEDDLEKANDERDKAMSAFSNGEFGQAVEHYTAAIQLNPGSAILHAKRANALLKLQRPVAAIADCDKAIKINPDSAQGYKFRGRAKALLGQWVEAHTDLATACRLDYDDTANEWLKAVEPNAKKLLEYNRAVARQNEERELKERRERVRRAQEANRKAAEEAAQHGGEDDFNFGAGGMPGAGMGGLGGLFNDPEIAAAMQDPEVLPAFMDIMSNPNNMSKYMNNPKIMNLVMKMKGMAMGGEGEGGMPGGCPMGSDCHDSECGSGPAPDAPPTAGHTSKVPEPDLD